MTTTSDRSDIPDVIQAKAFQLVDDNGNVRAELRTEHDGEPSFVDKDGLTRLEAGLNGGDGFLTLLNEDGCARFSLDFNESGNTALTLHDRYGEPRLVADLNESDEPVLTLNDLDGEPRLIADLGTDGRPSIGLCDVNGQRRLVAALTQSDQPGLYLSDQNSKPRIITGLDESGRPALFLRDQDGKDRLLAELDGYGGSHLALRGQDGQHQISAWVKESGMMGLGMSSPRERLFASLSGPYDFGIPQLSLTGEKGRIDLGWGTKGIPSSVGLYVYRENEGNPSAWPQQMLAAIVGSIGPRVLLEHGNRVTNLMADKIDKYKT